jgi:hypothetical protein
MTLPLLLSFSLFAAAIDADMTASEKKRTGIHRLKAREKSALQQWVDANYERRSEPLPKRSAPKRAVPTIQEVIHNGSYIRLSDNTLWKIHPDDTTIALGWITPVEIIVAPSNDPEYPYTLTNSLTSSTLRAQKVDKIPSLSK